MATQPVEYKYDTGDHHIGISIFTEKRELVSAQYELLPDEPEQHRDRAVNRRNRRGRKRHRKPRFDNLKPKLGSLASAAHMNAFRWSLWEKLQNTAADDVTMHMTYGAATKGAPRTLNIAMCHANGAYAMGGMHPKKRHVVHGAHRGGTHIILENALLSQKWTRPYIPEDGDSCNEGGAPIPPPLSA